MDAGEYWGWLMIEGAKAGAQVTIAKVTPVVKQQPDTTPAKLGMRAGRTTKTTQKLTWEKVEGADGYEIYAAPHTVTWSRHTGSSMAKRSISPNQRPSVRRQKETSKYNRN